MIGGSEFAYAQARLQARLGDRTSDDAWQPLAAIAEFRPFLEQVRATGLRHWVLNVSPISSSHEIERLLRAHLRARIDEIAGWLPERWRPAVRWTRWLIDVPALEHLLARHAALPWMLDDEPLKPIAAADPEARATVLAQGEYAPLARAVRHGHGQSLRSRWLEEWRARMPRLPKSHARRLDRLVTQVRAHLDTFAAEPSAGVRAGWEARHALERALVGHFRRAFLEPAVVFAFLLLMVLEFERLRGALVTRRLFAGEAH